MDPSRTKPALAQRIQQTPIVYAPRLLLFRRILIFSIGPLRYPKLRRREDGVVLAGEGEVVGLEDRVVVPLKRQKILIRRWRIIMSRLMRLLMLLLECD